MPESLPPSDSAKTPRELLPAFYEKYGLGDDGGQSSPYVRVEFTKGLALYIPNSDTRRKAVLKHDIHHLVTGYNSTFKGETEISAWELASGCKHYIAAFLLDLHGMTAGLLFNPLGVFRAFARGRHTTNLYNDAFPEEELLDTPLSKIHDQLGLGSYSGREPARPGDWVLFLSLCLLGIVYSVVSLAFLPFILIYSLLISLTKKEPRAGKSLD